MSLGAMIGMAGENSDRPIDLLHQHDAGESVRQRHGAERQGQMRTLPRETGGVAVGAADQQGGGLHAFVAPRAHAYFRKAQACLSQGDLGGALFNLRLAVAADPASAMIRVALAEVESEIRGSK